MYITYVCYENNLKRSNIIIILYRICYPSDRAQLLCIYIYIYTHKFLTMFAYTVRSIVFIDWKTNTVQQRISMSKLNIIYKYIFQYSISTLLLLVY